MLCVTFKELLVQVKQQNSSVKMNTSVQIMYTRLSVINTLKRPVLFGSVTKDFVKRRQSRVYQGHFLDSVVKWCSPQFNRVNKESVFSHAIRGVLMVNTKSRMYCTSFLIGSIFDSCYTTEKSKQPTAPIAQARHLQKLLPC